MSDRGPVGRWIDRLLGVAVLAALSAVLVQPGGAVRTHIDRILSERRVGAVLEDRWHEIAGRARSDGPWRPVLVEFMDYQCPFCRNSEDTLAAYAREHDLEIVYRHYPIAVLHPRAEEAARAAICAEEAGVFEQAHTYLIRETWWEEPEPLKVRWKHLGVTDSASFHRCLTSPRVEQRLREDRDIASELDVRGTPLFVGPEGVHRGLISSSDIGDLIGASGANPR